MLANSLELSLSELSQPPSDLSRLSSKVWATALVLAFIIKRFDSLKAEWELVADKSKSWIDKQLKAEGLYNTATCSSSKLIARAQDVLRKA